MAHPFSAMKKWKWSCSGMSDSLQPVNYSLPGSGDPAVHGIFQARVLELLFPSPGIWCNTCNLLQQMRQLFKYWHGTICKILFTSKYKETEPLFIVIQETSYVFASNKETRWIGNQISKETLLIISFLIVWAIWMR